jgi:hypothetical protein
MRLMGTAKTADRRSIIRDSLVNLDSPDRMSSHNKRLGSAAALMAARHNNIFDTEKVSVQFIRILIIVLTFMHLQIAAETVFLKSPPIRPMSARLRRPSVNNLDVIQEV